MLKILLMIGGVWFSLAFLFVVALAAAGAKPMPSAESTQVHEAVPAAEPETNETSPAPRRKHRWQIWKPARA